VTTEPVWITGIGLVSCLGEGADAHLAALEASDARPMVDEEGFAPFPVHPLPALDLDRQIPKRGDQRQMEPWQRLGTYAAGLAIDSAGARGLVADMHLVVAAGGGERDTALDEAVLSELATMAAGASRALAERALGGRAAAHAVPGAAFQSDGRQRFHRPRRHRLVAHLHGRGAGGADAVRIAAARLAEGRGGIAWWAAPTPPGAGTCC
jgi:3-oxoacyl-[acyl-carrier-protein] synthase II